MGNQEIHGNIFTIHVLIYFVSDNLWHPVKVQICKVLYKGEKKKTIKTLQSVIFSLANFRHSGSGDSAMGRISL